MICLNLPNNDPVHWEPPIKPATIALSSNLQEPGHSTRLKTRPPIRAVCPPRTTSRQLLLTTPPRPPVPTVRQATTRQRLVVALHLLATTTNPERTRNRAATPATRTPPCPSKWSAHRHHRPTRSSWACRIRCSTTGPSSKARKSQKAIHMT